MTRAEAVKTFYTDAEKRGRVGRTIHEYMGFFDESNGGGIEARKTRYATMINNYYDVVTDFYEHGWGQSFHFAARARGESFEASLARAEHYVALRLGLSAGMKVLDVGCGDGFWWTMRDDRREIYGIDISAREITQARKRINAELADVSREPPYSTTRFPVTFPVP